MNISKDFVVNSALTALGVNSKHNGFKYLHTAVLKVISKPKYIFDLNHLYAEIAKESGASGSTNVLADIRNAIAWASKTGNLTTINKMFGVDLFTEEYIPRNGEFIRLIAEYYNLKLYIVNPVDLLSTKIK